MSSSSISAEVTLEQNYAKIERVQRLIRSVWSQFRELLSEEQRDAIADGKEISTEVIYQKIVEKQSAMVSRINELQSRTQNLW